MYSIYHNKLHTSEVKCLVYADSSQRNTHIQTVSNNEEILRCLFNCSVSKDRSLCNDSLRVDVNNICSLSGFQAA